MNLDVWWPDKVNVIGYLSLVGDIRYLLLNFAGLCFYLFKLTSWNEWFLNYYLITYVEKDSLFNFIFIFTIFFFLKNNWKGFNLSLFLIANNYYGFIVYINLF